MALDTAETEKLRAERESASKPLEPGEAQGMTAEEILSYFYDQVVFTRGKKGWKTAFDAERMRGVKLIGRPDRRQDRRGGGRGRHQDDAARSRARSRKTASPRCWRRART